MKIDVDLVKRYFMLYSDLSFDDASRWDVTCRAAAGFVERRLKPGVDANVRQERLCAAAAGWAYGEYLMLNLSGGGLSDEIKVGDIAMKNSSSAKSAGKEEADEIKTYFLGQIADLITSGASVFHAIGGNAGQGDDEEDDKK